MLDLQPSYVNKRDPTTHTCVGLGKVPGSKRHVDNTDRGGSGIEQPVQSRGQGVP